MSSRATELIQGIVDELRDIDASGQFSFDTVTIKKSYAQVYELESLEAWPTLFVRMASKTSTPASRIQYKQDYTIVIEIVGKLSEYADTTDDGVIENIEQWIDFADEVERAMKENCRLIADCTLLSITCDPICETGNLEDTNIFRAFQEYTYTITERNTLGA
jgi:hypothetical protein